MKRTSLSSFKNKIYDGSFVKIKNILLAVSLVLVLSAFFIFNSLSNFGQLTAGGETCFTRVRQSLTAMARNSYSSTFLSSDFFNNTNRCFDELKHLSTKFSVQSFAGEKLPSLVAQISSDVFEFSQKALMQNKVYRKKNQKSKSAALKFSQETQNSKQSSILEDGFIAQSKRFESLEKDYLILMETISLTRTNLELALTVVLILLTFFILTLLYSSLKLRSSGLNSAENIFIEAVAADFIKLNKYSAKEFEEIINLLRKRFKLLNTGNYIKAFADYNTADELKFDNIERISAEDDNENIPAVTSESEGLKSDLLEGSSIINRQIAIDREEEDFSNVALKEIKPLTTEIASFDESFQTSIDLVREQAFKHGIVFNLDIEDEIYVQVPREDLSQVLYTLVNVCIQYSTLHNKGRQISLRLKGLGDQSVFSVMIENFCFGTKELEFFNNESIGQKKEDSQIENLGVDVIILKESLSGLGVNFLMKNIFEKSSYRGNIQLFFKQVPRPENFRSHSSKTSVILPEGPAKNSENKFDKELKTLFKGTKKDLLQKIGRKKKKKRKRQAKRA